MGTIIHKTGNIFTSEAPAIGHGVNVKAVMGHGIAVLFRNEWPEMYLQYRHECWEGMLPGETFVYDVEPPKSPEDVDPEAPKFKTVYNIASQHKPGPDAKLEWLDEGVRSALKDAQEKGHDRIALPWIGAGIGGLNRVDVELALTEAALDYNVDIEIWTLP